MKNSKVYYNNNGSLEIEHFIDQSDEDICSAAFNKETESEYIISTVGIRFSPEEKIMHWNSNYAHYCFGKGRLTFPQFKEFCTIEFEKK